MAIVVKAESGRKPQRPVRRQVPCNDGCQVVRSLPKTKAVPIPQPSVHFHPGDEVLPAKTAPLCRRFQCQWTANSDRITELPRITSGQRLRSKWIQCEVPSVVRAREQQLQFEFVIMLLPQNCVRNSLIGLDVVPLYLFQDLVRFADLLVLDVEHRIDQVL